VTWLTSTPRNRGLARGIIGIEAVTRLVAGGPRGRLIVLIADRYLTCGNWNGNSSLTRLLARSWQLSAGAESVPHSPAL